MKTPKLTPPALAAVIGLSLLPGYAGAQDEASAPPNPGAQNAPAAQFDNEKVVITVDDTPITQGDVHELFMAKFARQLQQMPQEQQAMLQPQIEQMVINELISKTLLLNAAEDADYEVSEEEVDKALEEIAKSIPEGASLEEFAARAGVDLDRIRLQIEQETKIQQLVEKVTSDVEAPDEKELKTFFDENPDKFKQPATVEASHILLKTEEGASEEDLAATKKEIESIHKQLVADDGPDFAEMAEKHSDDPSKARGGELGSFGKGQMVPEFEEVAFSQEIGAISEPVKSQFGYHLIKVTGKTEEKEMSFNEVKEELAEGLLEQRKSEKMKTYLEELRDKAEIDQKEGQAPGQPGTGQPGSGQPAPGQPAPPAPTPGGTPQQ
ncbi:MAG: peptidylprolyl isomerase [Verrucomicrobiales bacterium]